MPSFSSNQFHRGSWLVYLNGIEVPCPDVTVSYGIWQIPTATMSFPPHRYLQRLGAEDRIDVTIFWLDDLTDPAKPAFRLLFEGEMLGWGYTNSSFGRAMTFDAIGDIAVFTQLYFFYMNTVEAAVQQATGIVAANAPSHTNIFYPASLFYKGIITVSKDGKPQPNVSTPFEILYNCVRGLIDANIPADKRTIPSVNFFSRWVKKRNFHQRFVALPLFEDPGDENVGVFPIFKAAQSEAAFDAVRQGLAPTVGESGTIYDNLKNIFDKVYTELAMIPTAPALRVRSNDGVILSAHDESPVYADQPVRLANYFVKPQMSFSIPPSCNVIFPSMVKSHVYRESFRDQPTRVYVNDSFIPQVLGSENAFTAAALRVGYPPEVNASVKRAVSAGEQDNKVFAARVMANSKNLLVYPEEFFKGPVTARMQIPSWFTILMQQSKARRAEAAQKADEAATKQELNSIQQLFEVYAQYEYYRQRYAKRGGAVDMAWNPYIVPGFPCVIFDKRENSCNTVGYVTSVTQSMSARGKGGSMSTSIQYSFGRTIYEMLELLERCAQDYKFVAGNAPLEPVDQIRNIAQDFEKAEQLYGALFFGRRAANDTQLEALSQATAKKKASFDFRELLGYVTEYDENAEPKTVEEMKFEGLSAAARDLRTTMAAVTTVLEKLPEVTSNLSEAVTKEVVPLPKVKPYFERYDAAMKYVSRPICSLEEYLAFMHSGKSVETLLEDQQVAGPQLHYCDEGTTAIYYDRIRKLRQGPGARPTAAQTGTEVAAPVGQAVNGETTLHTGEPEAVSPDFAQTREDWDTVLLAYRAEMALKRPLR